MANLTPVQETRLANVKVADQAWRKAKTDAHATLRAAIEHEIAGRAAQRDMEVRLAFDAGVSKAKINKEGLGTSNPGTVTDSLARTESTMAAIVGRVEPALVVRYTFVPANEDQSIWWDSIRVHMDGAEYEAWKAGEGKKRFRVNGNAASIDAGVFQITDDGGPGVRTYESFDRSTPNTFDTAVGGWLQGPGRAEVRAWIAGNTPERIVVEEETED